MNVDTLKAAVAQHGSNAAAARFLGIPDSTLRARIKGRPERKASGRANIGTDQANIEDGQTLRGLSTLIDMRDGSKVLQWVKTSTDDIKADIARNAVHAALSEDLPRYLPSIAPGQCNDDLMSVYVLTDYHLGQLCWAIETGSEDWDLKKAESMLINWFATAIQQSPPSRRAVFAQMGDFMHWDGMDAVTPQHHHQLDADTRFAKLVRSAIRVIRTIIRMLAEKHEQLEVIIADANHDPASGAWMREWLSAVYEDDSRIHIETSAEAYYCIEHGLTMCCFHHGHKRGVKDVDRVMAGRFSEIFGRTKYRYAHLGHLHSDEVNETALMKVERHRTLAPPDAYAAKGGWISGRDSKVITYSKQFGEISRLIISPDMVRANHG